MELRERFKMVREDNNLTQEEYGNRLGISSRSHISSLESGARNITDRIIKDVCREFKVAYEWMTEGKGEPYSKNNRKKEISAWAASLVSKNKKDNEFALKFAYALSQLSVDEWGVLEKISRIMTEDENDRE